MGELDEGWEWFAFTFKDQEQISLSKEEIENMIETSDSVVRKAYSRMDLTETNQLWMKHTSSEIDFILSKIPVTSGEWVYDLGCGVGRHSVEFAKRGMNVVGIDYIPENVAKAREYAEREGASNIQILEGDCRSYEHSQKASLVLCLYDVVGTFAEEKENARIVKSAFQLLKEFLFAESRNSF